MRYEFRFEYRGGDVPAVEFVELPGDGAAVARAASELLQMPSRTGVVVRRGEHVIYRHVRRARLKPAI